MSTASKGALRRVDAVVSEWERELKQGRIVDPDARYCWELAAREIRRAMGDESS